MFLLPIKLDRVSFETKGQENLQKIADLVIESIIFCPIVPHISMIITVLVVL